MWESPITKITEDIMKDIVKKEEEILIEAVHHVGFDVDKEELAKALVYDRDQYDKGYRDGRAARDAEIVRCVDCKHLSDDWIAPEWYRRCRIYGCGKAEDGFCDKGERSEDDTE